MKNNSSLERVEILLSKKKILFLCIVSVIFAILSGLLVYSISSGDTKATSRVTIGAWIGLVFFSIGAILLFKRMFDPAVGLVVDSQGITDNSSGSGFGFIKWDDIVGIRVLEISRNKFLLIDVANSDTYLANIKGIKRKLMESNENMYNTPFSITCSTLKYKFTDLEKLLQDSLEKYKTSNRE